VKKKKARKKSTRTKVDTSEMTPEELEAYKLKKEKARETYYRRKAEEQTRKSLLNKGEEKPTKKYKKIDVEMKPPGPDSSDTEEVKIMTIKLMIFLM